MRSEPLTFNDIQANFNAALQAAIDTGEGPKSAQGFEPEIIESIYAVAQAYPNVTPDLIQNANQAWRRQASGAQRAERAASLVGTAAAYGYSTGDSLA